MTVTTAISASRRVTVVAPHTRADVSLPLQASIADVVLQLVTLVDLDMEDPTASAGGWVLSRLGGQPFDVEGTVGASDIRDGDVLYLSSRRSRLPVVVFDDVVDAVASAASTRPGQWTPHTTRRAGLLVAGALAAVALGLLLDAGPGWVLPTTAAALAGVVLVLCAGLTSRFTARPDLGAAIGAVGVTFLTAAGLLLTAGDRELVDLTAPQLLLGCVALTLSAAVTLVVVGARAPAHVTGAGLGLLGGGWLAADLLVPTTTATVAATGVTVLLLLGLALPGAAMRLARLPFPYVPADPAEFRRDDVPLLDSDVMAETRRADAFLTGLLLTVFTSIVLASVALLRDVDLLGGSASGPGWAGGLVAAAGAVTLLRARHLRHVGQRVVMLSAGLVLVGMVLVPGLHALGTTGQLAVATGVVGLGAPLLTLAVRAPVRNLSPYLGRTLDVLEVVAAVVVVPCLVGVLDLYARVLSFGG